MNLMPTRTNIQSPLYPGYPLVTAPRFPAATRWYEGRRLRGDSRFVGRAAMLDDVMQALESIGNGNPRSIALTGIGGIG